MCDMNLLYFLSLPATLGMEVLHQLVRVVARSFYDDKYIVIFDTIVRETM